MQRLRSLMCPLNLLGCHVWWRRVWKCWRLSCNWLLKDGAYQAALHFLFLWGHGAFPICVRTNVCVCLFVNAVQHKLMLSPFMRPLFLGWDRIVIRVFESWRFSGGTTHIDCNYPSLSGYVSARTWPGLQKWKVFILCITYFHNCPSLTHFGCVCTTHVWKLCTMLQNLFLKALPCWMD